MVAPQQTILAIDGMGGDAAPDIVVGGVVFAARNFPDVRFLIYGDEARLRPLVNKHGILRQRVEIRHTDQVVENTDKPSSAIRNRRDSSMGKAIAAVQEGAAQGVVSAGNTGALMAMAMFALRTAPGIDRPAIATVCPSVRGPVCMLDLGANISCDAVNLVQFALMGKVFARTVMNIESPTVGLLNVGVEEMKGRAADREAAAILSRKDIPVTFAGFVEGDGIASGIVDVVVTDGYTGNVALKVMEGTGRLLSFFLRETFTQNLMGRISGMLATPALRRLKQRVDPRLYNGAVLLGLNGTVVKSHGGTDALGFANAVGVAIEMVQKNYADRIRRNLENMDAIMALQAKDGAKPDNGE